MADDISDLTGLPEAPEGMFWRVKNASWHSSDALYARFEIQLIQPMMVVQEFRRWFRKNEERFVKDEIVVDRFFLGEDLVDVTSDRILGAARHILNQREKKRAAQELLGDYPPKKLEQVEKIDG